MGNTILIAEDDIYISHMLAKLFGEAGFTVFQAQTCQEAVQLASQHIPDCFLLDYHLADGPIPVVCTFIRTHETLKNAPIIILSSHTDEMENAYNSCQADFFVEKGGCPPLTLPAVLNRHLRRVEHNCDPARQSDLSLDSATLRVLRHGAPLASLSLEQFKLFSALFIKRPDFVSGSELAACIFADLSSERQGAICSLVSRLRRSLGPRYGRRIVCKNSRGWAYVQTRMRPKNNLKPKNLPAATPT